MNNLNKLNSALNQIKQIEQKITSEEKSILEQGPEKLQNEDNNKYVELLFKVPNARQWSSSIQAIKSIIQGTWDPDNGLPKDFKSNVHEKELLKRFVTQLIESSDIQPKSDKYIAKKLLKYLQELGEIEGNERNDPSDETNANKLIAKIEDIIRGKEQALTDPNIINAIKILFSPEGTYPAFLKNISDEGIKNLFDTIQHLGNEIMSEKDWELYFWNNFRPLFNYLTQNDLQRLGEEVFGEYFKQESNKALKIFLIACGQDKALELIGNYFNNMTEKLTELFNTLSPKVVPNNPKPANNI